MTTRSDDQPFVVGRYFAGGKAEFLPATRRELDRNAEAYARVISTCRFAPGRYALVVSLLEEAVQVAPLEQACIDLGLVVTNADASLYDAGRVESIIRRFDVACVFGVNAATLDGLKMFGHDAAKVLGSKTIWVRPDGYAAAKALPGVDVRRWIDIGPALGLECSDGAGAHIDGREWEIDERGGTIHLTSRLHRAAPFAAADTGLRGRHAAEPCSCGGPDPRIILEG